MLVWIPEYNLFPLLSQMAIYYVACLELLRAGNLIKEFDLSSVWKLKVFVMML